MNFLKTIFRRETPRTEKEAMTSPAIAVHDEAPVRNLAAELRVAEASVSEATRKKRIHDAEILETSRTVGIATREVARVDGTFEGRTDHYESMRRTLRELTAKLPRLQTESQAIEKELANSQAVVHRVRRQIIEHPVYAAAIAEQTKIIIEGVEVAQEAWSGSLANLPSVVKRFNAIADREIEFEHAANTRLREAGLPEIRVQLMNSRDTLPSMIANLPLDEMKTNCSAALELLRAYRGGIPAV